MEIIIESTAGKFPAFLRWAESGKDAPTVILIHEVWGLNDNIREIAARLAAEGYDVLAPDLMSGLGIDARIGQELFREMSDPGTRNEAQKKLREMLAPINSPEFGKKMMARLGACYKYLSKGRKDAAVAAVGFCFGGTYSFACACELPLRAAVVFYGRPPEPLSKIASVGCPVLGFYGERDTALVDGLPALEAEMSKNGKRFSSVVYKGCGHAFFNRENTMMYNEAAASDSWKRMLAFLKENLG